MLSFVVISLNNVIAGLDPAIQRACEIGWIYAAFLDRRVKPGDDSLGGGYDVRGYCDCSPGVNQR